MCGISGYILKNKDNIHEENLKNISHRGPDDNNTIEFKAQNFYIKLCFYRLSIIDIEHGMQPFYCEIINDQENRKIYLLCNGEIYNYKNLIQKYNLMTTSDCHVILDLYKKFGIEHTIKLLDGEFAFVLIDIIDDSEIKIFMCRDRFGIRPLFYNYENYNLYFASELKALANNGDGQQLEPRNIYYINTNPIFNYKFPNKTEYYNLNFKLDNSIEYIIFENIRKSLIKSVEDRMITERPLGCLLSGGLDSSLVAGIASRILKKKGQKLKTFCIGIEADSPDIKYAKKVSEFIESDHHEVIIPVQKWLDAIPDVIKQLETYDITTIRASTGQYLLAKWISENTDIKVILNGDGSDELTSGYIYFYNTPTPEESHKENIRLLENIHKYDVLRVDRSISRFGLEARVPFLSHDFVWTYLTINKCLRYPVKDKRIEKFYLRKSFESENIIPEEVLWRKKEAFSDGVSSIKKSWFEYIKEYVDTIITDEEYFTNDVLRKIPSKEAYWYKKLFTNFYPNYKLEVEYWMPKWSNENKDPSARVLTNYKK